MTSSQVINMLQINLAKTSRNFMVAIPTFFVIMHMLYKTNHFMFFWHV